MAYKGYVWIQCPRCKEFRQIRRSSHVQMRRMYRLGQPVYCRKCGQKKYSEDMDNFRRANDKATRAITKLKVNGCTLVPAEGRDPYCLNVCKHYDECLTAVCGTRWEGWKRGENDLGGSPDDN